jgi:hypothetical protein
MKDTPRKKERRKRNLLWFSMGTIVEIPKGEHNSRHRDNRICITVRVCVGQRGREHGRTGRERERRGEHQLSLSLSFSLLVQRQTD